jgi:hypothetical protein
MAQCSDAIAKRADIMQQLHRQKIKEWRPLDLPAAHARCVREASATSACERGEGVNTALGVSERSSSNIEAGKRIPHPRRWQMLAQ